MPCTATRRLIMQKARRHPITGLRPLVSARFQVLFHSPVRGSFHLSFTVLVRYRPALLRILLRVTCLPVRAFHPLRTAFPDRSRSQASTTLESYNPGRALTLPVWALPRSLATTCGIIVIFSSCGYLDVSVPRVCPLLRRVSTSLWTGCPIRKSPDQRLFAPPRSLSQLITSFFASESQVLLRL